MIQGELLKASVEWRVGATQLDHNVKLSNSAIISYVCQQNHLSQEQRERS
jgi:hypothetical protein